MIQDTTFQVTLAPSNLMMALNPRCCKMLLTLLSLSERYSDDNGWFSRSNRQLVQDSNLSKKVVIATIDTLYRHGIVDVKCIGQGKGSKTNEYKINFSKFKEFDELLLEEFADPRNRIKMVNYKEKGYKPMYY